MNADNKSVEGLCWCKAGHQWGLLWFETRVSATPVQVLLYTGTKKLVYTQPEGALKQVIITTLGIIHSLTNPPWVMTLDKSLCIMTWYGVLHLQLFLIQAGNWRRFWDQTFYVLPSPKRNASRVSDEMQPNRIYTIVCLFLESGSNKHGIFLKSDILMFLFPLLKHSFRKRET